VVGFHRNGGVRATIPVPAARPTSIAFGGPELATLYVTSARVGLSETDLATWPASGCVFELDVTTPGLPANVFGGEPWTKPS
jgi:sugar lactone lactonase YvrE